MPRDVAATGQDLELGDIQGGILTAYGKQGFPKARYLLVNVRDAAAGRALIRSLYPSVTTAVRWPSTKYGHFGKFTAARPKVTLNLAFTFWGLAALGLPIRILNGMPEEFIEGMAARGVILGDNLYAKTAADWDEVWRHELEPDRGQMVHMLIMLSAQMDPATGLAIPELEALTAAIAKACQDSDGKLALLAGHDAQGAPYQEMSALLRESAEGFVATAQEHFGFTDSISDPVFSGQFPAELEAERVRGNGKLLPDGTWAPLATGEFLLGYPDEAQEIPVNAMARGYARNGTFFAYRKLQENAVAFHRWLGETAPRFAATFGIEGGPEAATATLMAKIAGRWPDGAPLALYPDYEHWRQADHGDPGRVEHRRQLSDFAYYEDPVGARCPLASHTRRTNPRDTEGPIASDGTRPSRSGTALSNRRRILRRGVAYGRVAPDAQTDTEHGMVILFMCASLTRQFEFVQQQWINYGADAQVGNDTDPLIGGRPGKTKFVIPTDPLSGHAPFIADALPQFVEARGGAYFFMPGMNGLKMLGLGIVDPT